MYIIDKSLQMSRDIFPSLYEKSNRYQAWHFTFIYKRNKLLSYGYNDYQISGRAYYFSNKFNLYNKNFPALHSEMSAINKLWGKYHIDNTLKIVNIRINKFNELQNSKPCLSCSKLLNELGLKKIWYSYEGRICVG